MEAALEMSRSLKQPEGFSALWRPFVFLFLGKTDEAKAIYEEIRDGSTKIPSHRNGWYLRYLQFGCGELTVKEFIAAIDQPRPSNMNRNDAHFFVGMQFFSEGRRREAKPHFENCVQTGLYGYLEHKMSRAILEKWKKDPNWPPWIPVRKEKPDEQKKKM